MCDKCPKCGETENFHYLYNYEDKPVTCEEILCNECGTFFPPNKENK